MSTPLLRLARWMTPTERSEWLKAMEAEYQALGSAHTRWALGCVAVAAGWRLKKDGVYAALVAAAIWFLCGYPLSELEARLIPREFWNVGFYPDPFYMATFTMVLGIYRPRLVVLTAFAIILVWHVQGADAMYDRWAHPPPEANLPADRDTSVWMYLQELTIYDAKFIIGIFSQFGACLGGGLIGRAIARRLRPALAR